MAANSTRSGRAFTLIELLVVIAIIAVIMSILLPALAGGREAAMALKCQIRIRSLAQAAEFYARDNEDVLWDNEPRDGWARKQVGRLVLPGPVFEYSENAGEMLACPKNRRQNPYGQDKREIEDVPQVEGAQLDFDFTLAVGAQGAKTTVESKIHYLDRSRWIGLPPSTFSKDEGLANLERFRALPVFIEESSYWYNSQDTDGRWSNVDQFTTRHFGDGYYSMIDLSVERFDVFAGRSESELEEGDDSTHRDWYVFDTSRARLHFWKRVYEVATAFGDINSHKFRAYP